MPEAFGVEFTCVDCKSEVWAAVGPVPVPPRCATCLWIAAEIDPADYPKVRDALGVGKGEAV